MTVHDFNAVYISWILSSPLDTLNNTRVIKSSSTPIMQHFQSIMCCGTKCIHSYTSDNHNCIWGEPQQAILQEVNSEIHLLACLLACLIDCLFATSSLAAASRLSTEPTVHEMCEWPIKLTHVSIPCIQVSTTYG